MVKMYGEDPPFSPNFLYETKSRFIYWEKVRAKKGIFTTIFTTPSQLRRIEACFRKTSSPSSPRMPNAPLRPCRHPGCAALVPSGYCDSHRTHTAKAFYDDTRRKQNISLSMSARIRSSAQWQKVRALHRRLSPFCCDPFGQHTLPAYNQASHHIRPLATHPHLAFDLTNLAPLCTSCHARIEAMERAGKPTEQLFARPPTPGEGQKSGA